MAGRDRVQQVDRHHVAVKGTLPVIQLRPYVGPGPGGVQAKDRRALLLQGGFLEHLGRLGQFGSTASATAAGSPLA